MLEVLVVYIRAPFSLVVLSCQELHCFVPLLEFISLDWLGDDFFQVLSICHSLWISVFRFFMWNSFGISISVFCFSISFCNSISVFWFVLVDFSLHLHLYWGICFFMLLVLNLLFPSPPFWFVHQIQYNLILGNRKIIFPVNLFSGEK